MAELVNVWSTGRSHRRRWKSAGHSKLFCHPYLVCMRLPQMPLASRGNSRRVLRICGALKSADGSMSDGAWGTL